MTTESRLQRLSHTFQIPATFHRKTTSQPILIPPLIIVNLTKQFTNANLFNQDQIRKVINDIHGPIIIEKIVTYKYQTSKLKITPQFTPMTEPNALLVQGSQTPLRALQQD